MSPPIVGIIGIGVMFLLFASRIRIGYAMAIAGFLGFSYLISTDAGFSILGTIPYFTTASYTLSVIPLFILMGQLALYSGISGDLYEAAHKWIGHLPGGLAMASTGACAAFGAITGSTTATVATMGSVALPEMRRYGYQPELSTAAIAAGASLSLLIPPSVAFIVYGIITEQSIGKLFISGIFPGLLLAFLLMAAIYIVCLRNPSLAPPGPRVNFRERLASLKVSLVVVVLFLVMMGGIYMGVFTPTEAAGAGAFLVFLFSLFRRKITWQNLFTSLRETVTITAMVFVIVIGALIFGRFLSVTRLPFELAELVSELAVSPYIILIFISIFYLLFGCIMDAMALILITMPIVFPVVLAVGFDPIWFGVITVLLGNMAIITPPVGINVYVVSGVAKVPVETVFKGIVPFLIAMAICIIIVTIFPQIALFLPNIMK